MCFMTVIGLNANIEAYMENHVASSTEELLSIARSGFAEIGYQEELLRSGYQFADFLSPSCPVRGIQL